MTERKRLIELMTQAENEELSLLKFEKKILADYLLTNGVIVLPYRIGTTVRMLNFDKVEEYEIASYIVDDEISHVNLAHMEGNTLYGQTLTIKEFEKRCILLKKKQKKH